MPVFMIERHYAEELELDAAALEELHRINDEESVQWLYSFLSADRRRTYWLYEASSAEAIRQAATRAGIPADVVVEVTGLVRPDGALEPV